MPTPLSQLKTLCNRDNNNVFRSKQGQAYITALDNLFHLSNRNDKPFTIDDVMRQPLLNDFRFAGVNDFTYICNLVVKPMEIMNSKRKNERIIPQNFVAGGEEIFKNSSGVAYLLTAITSDGAEHIVKIGQTRTPFKNRLQSYNCGCVANWRTASTTNIKILQSMVTTRLTFKLYLCDCSADAYQIVWYGVTSNSFATPRSLAIEDIMIRQFIEQFGHKPLANIQANPT